MASELRLGMMVEYLADGRYFQREGNHLRLGRVMEIQHGFRRSGDGASLMITIHDIETGDSVYGVARDVVSTFDMTRHEDVERWLAW